MDLYDEIGVGRNATEAQIKAAGRRRQKATHPDAGGKAEDFGRVQKALRVLLDPDKRAHYDRTGDADAGSAPDTSESEAINFLVMLIADILKAVDPARVHLPQSITQRTRGELSRATDAWNSQKGQMTRQVTQLEKVLRRLKPTKKNRNDMLSAVIRSQIGAIQRELAQHEAAYQHKKTVYERVLAFAENYDYEVETSTAYPDAFGSALLQELRRSSIFD